MKVDFPTYRATLPDGRVFTGSVTTSADPRDVLKWECHLDRIACRRRHPYIHHKTGYHVKDRRDGHLWLACETCSPTSFMFGVAVVRPGLIVWMYEISRAQFDYWANNTDELPDDPKLAADPTLEILHYLGYADWYKPFYRPATLPPPHV